MRQCRPGANYQNFMGFGNRTKFLGHGIGLAVDELPVIARGLTSPSRKGWLLPWSQERNAGVGMVGIENTFIVTADGSECITGAGRGHSGVLETCICFLLLTVRTYNYMRQWHYV